MAKNFPGAWLKRVKNNLSTADQASFINGIPELDYDVTLINPGTETEKNTIYVPTSVFEPTVLMNSTTLDVGQESYTDDQIALNLNKFDTMATEVTEDQADGAEYDKIDNATKSHVKAINKKKYAASIHGIAPDSDSTSTPIVATTGDPNGTATGSRLRLLYEDIVALKEKADLEEWPEDGRRLVLCKEHENDILRDRKQFGDQMIDYKSGKLGVMIAGFEIYSYIKNPYYTDTTKKPFGSVPGAGDFQASVAFCTENIGMKTGKTRQYFDLPTTRRRSNLVNYRHFFICSRLRNKYIGAIVSGKKPA